MLSLSDRGGTVFTALNNFSYLKERFIREFPKGFVDPEYYRKERTSRGGRLRRMVSIGQRSQIAFFNLFVVRKNKQWPY